MTTVALSVTTADVDAGAGVPNPLTLANGFAELVEYDPGGVTRRRQLLRSPTVRGARQTGSVPDQRLVIVRLRIFGTSKALLDTHTKWWQQAFDQASYSVTVTLDGVATTWRCDDADFNLFSDAADGVDKYRLAASPMRQLWEFRCPADPDPTAGVF